MLASGFFGTLGGFPPTYRGDSLMIDDALGGYEAAMAVAVKNARPLAGAEVDDGDAHWYAVLCEAGGDALTARHLVRRGFGIFQPYARNGRHLPQCDGTHRRIDTRELAFPGYIFVRAWNIDKMIKRLLACPGVAGVLSFAGTERPAPISDEFISLLLYELDWLEHGTGHVAVAGRRNRKRRPRPSHKISNRNTRRASELLNKWAGEVGRLDSQGRIGRLLETILPSRS